MDYIQLHGHYQSLRNQRTLAGPTHEIKGRLKESRVAIQQQVISKTLEPSDMILQQFHHVAMHTSLEWAQHALADDMSNTTTKRFNV